MVSADIRYADTRHGPVAHTATRDVLSELDGITSHLKTQVKNVNDESGVKFDVLHQVCWDCRSNGTGPPNCCHQLDWYSPSIHLIVIPDMRMMPAIKAD